MDGVKQLPEKTIMNITINVTQGDIEAGIAGKCDRCPIALAIVRIKQPSYIDVDTDAIVFASPEGRFRVKTPEVAVNFMNAFDFGKVVCPFVFDAEFHQV